MSEDGICSEKFQLTEDARAQTYSDMVTRKDGRFTEDYFPSKTRQPNRARSTRWTPSNHEYFGVEVFSHTM
jgi:hypothetical protein